MRRLKRTESGQINDVRYEEIQKEYVQLISPFLDKHKDIDYADLMLVCHTAFNFELTKSKIRAYAEYEATHSSQK